MFKVIYVDEFIGGIRYNKYRESVYGYKLYMGS